MSSEEPQPGLATTARVSISFEVEQRIFGKGRGFVGRVLRRLPLSKGNLSIYVVDAETGNTTEKAFIDLWSRKATEKGFKAEGEIELPPGMFSPGAVVVTNHGGMLVGDKVRLRAVELNAAYASGHETYLFPCHSWIFKQQGERVFFTGRSYLPKDTPPGLRAWRERELEALKEPDYKERKAPDRIYHYDVYNDLGKSYKSAESTVEEKPKFRRPVLGGSEEFPYPRRLRTGRPLNADGKTESVPQGNVLGFLAQPLTFLEQRWLPEDEMFSESVKGPQQLAVQIVGVVNALTQLPEILDDSFRDIDHVNGLYKGATEFPSAPKVVPKAFSKALPKVDRVSDFLTRFPPPLVYEEREFAWMTDEEVGRQAVAGVNPNTFQAIDSVPKGSGFSNETVPAALLEGKCLDERLQEGRMFLVDYTAAILPFVDRINRQEGRWQYAPRCLYFLSKTGGEPGSLRPVAIELSTPRSSNVYNPHSNSWWMWLMAKAHFTSTDNGVHALISHWLRTHCAIEPIAIATRRMLSELHPVHNLMEPHFKYTLHINALARNLLINADGNVEKSYTPGVYAFEITSAVYKGWRFKDQGLPEDLLKRKLASRNPDGSLDLVLKDYPFAQDGLLIWDAIHAWTTEYLQIYYKSDADVLNDEELMNWWKDIKYEAHGDLVNPAWKIADEQDVWPELAGVQDLVGILTTMIWLASAYHAAMNFPQWDYLGYFLNRPATCRREMPTEEELIPHRGDKKAQDIFMDMMPKPSAVATNLSLVEILATHGEDYDEPYLGTYEADRFADPEVAVALAKYKERLDKAEEEIKQRNADTTLKSRNGPDALPYTYLIPTLKKDCPGQPNSGIPNSTSI
eukprot:evm.model.scf_112.8 EVM.evm.TU.scf_112.8   scf_112:61810-67074(-)